MSFQITKPGPHRNRDGEQVQVQFIDGQYAFGTSMTLPRIWNALNGGAIYGPHADSIVGPYHEPPTPPEGFQLLPRNVKPWIGCQRWSQRLGWDHVNDDSYPERTAEEWDGNADAAPLWFASPIPKPFRISDHGCGVYETRDGRQVEVIQCGRICSFSKSLHESSTCYDSGSAWDDGVERPCDLVRYIGPLQWTPTETYRVEFNGAPVTTRKFTRGDEVEWREVQT